jgi:hypothetical protein
VKEKMQLFYKMTMPHPISFVMLWMLGFLINGLENWPPKVLTLNYWILSYRDM